MKNVTPAAGQVWKENRTGNDYVIGINPQGWIDGQSKTFGFGGYTKSAFLQEFTFQQHKETKMIDFSTAKGGDPAKAFRELGKVIDNLNKQKETTMIDLSTAKIGDEFVLRNGKVVSFFARTKMNSICQLKTGHAMLYEHSGKFDESVETGDKPKNWDIIAKHDSRTDEEKAIDDLIKPALIFAAGSGSYQKDAEKFLNVIKADEIHGIKWVVE